MMALTMITPPVLGDLYLSLVLLDDTAEIFALTTDITIGRHLDNDLIVAGEDVADFHARVEIRQRSLRLVPIAGALVSVNNSLLKDPVGLIPGDEILLGSHLLRLQVEATKPGFDWHLVSPGGEQRIALRDNFQIGRGSESSLQLQDAHISRQHALVRIFGSSLWIRDLWSANGTYVNGDRVQGGCRLFHGDVVSFDALSFQVIGSDSDLTPVMPFDPSLVQRKDQRTVDSLPGVDRTDSSLTSLSPTGLLPTPPGTAVDDKVSLRPTVAVSRTEVEMLQALTAQPLPGPALLVLAGDVPQPLILLEFGRRLVGRDQTADILLPDMSVSLRHAELDVRGDGVFITNLMSTNGVLVNGKPVHTVRLHHGDRLVMGKVLLEFRLPDSVQARRRSGFWHSIWERIRPR